MEVGAGTWRRVLVGALLLSTFLAGVIAIEISRATDTTASWWPAAGLGVVTLLVAPRTWWPRLVVGVFAANFLSNLVPGRPWTTAAGFATGDVLETVIVCWGARRLIGRRLAKVGDIASLLAVALVGALVAATFITLTAVWTLEVDLGRTFLITTTSHWASVLVIAPIGLLPRARVRRPSWPMLALHWVLLTALTLLAFGQRGDVSLAFVTLPFLIWAGVSFGSRVVVGDQVAVAGAVTWLTVGGFGPFATAAHPAGSMGSNLLTQLYLVGVAVTGLPLALAVRQQLLANREVRTEQRRTEAVIDSSTTPTLVTDGDGVVVTANPAVGVLSGYAPADVVGVPLWQLLFSPARWADLQHRFAQPEMLPEKGEATITTAAGDARIVTYARGTYRSPDDGSLRFVFTVHDVTDERTTQGLLQNVLRSATTVAILGTDRPGRITVANAGAERVLRFDAGSGPHDFVDFLDPDEVASRSAAAGVPAGFEALVHDVTEAEARTRDWSWIPPDGVPLVVSMTASMIADARHRPIGYLFVARDVTETRRHQELLREALRREQRAVDHLRALDDAKDDFVSTVSHELRTPLTSIVGSLELLADGTAGELAAQQLRMLDMIKRNAERLLAMTDDLLTLASQEGAPVVAQLVPLDLRSVVQASHASVTGLLSQRALTLSAVLPDHPVTVHGDSVYLERALTNLLSNAIKFTPDGGSITTRLSEDGVHGRLSVTDTGIGIPRDEVQDVFLRFFRSTNVRADAIQGTGLGLAIVRTIVERHHGQIDVESDRGRGTTFTITLPLAGALTLD